MRKLPGGAQAHLIEACDGSYYAVKFANNPQGHRVLINEWLASTLLSSLGLPCAGHALIELTPNFLAIHPELFTQYGTRQVAPLPGLHYGSRFRVNPEVTASYDWLPAPLLLCVQNLDAFSGMLVADQWLGNDDPRQAVFFRSRRAAVNEPPDTVARLALRAEMIDQGFCFAGPKWKLWDQPRQGLYRDPAVYAGLRTWSDYEPVLSHVLACSPEVVGAAIASVPTEWIVPGEQATLDRLGEQLWRRRKRVPDLLRECVRARPDYFPCWPRPVHTGGGVDGAVSLGPQLH